MLKDIKFGNNLTTIGNYAFAGCSSIETVEISAKVNVIGNYAFSGCTSLRNITLGDELSLIGTSAFEYCASLETIQIPQNVSSIGEQAFNACDKLTNIIVHDGITHIAARALYNCTSLEKAEIASTVTSIGTMAFSRCDDMTIYGFAGSFAEEYAMDYEVPFVDITPNPEYTLEVDFSETTKAWYFDVMVDGFLENANVYVGIYDVDNRLLALQCEEFAVEDITSFSFSKYSNASYYKVFMWKENIQPVCAAYTEEF